VCVILVKLMPPRGIFSSSSLVYRYHIAYFVSTTFG